ncbi:hypothetical protein AVEN_271530-1 [Araneus ventricosus]|uniref:Uncharacterized protein n=1 Tax=Araneus ventricosus TaxID=182803 RepID=A0A4Y2G1N6_ARAVE|nr:hypothetical protein AVEN_271530-1 [Araneus ventricosus]
MTWFLFGGATTLGYINIRTIYSSLMSRDSIHGGILDISPPGRQWFLLPSPPAKSITSVEVVSCVGWNHVRRPYISEFFEERSATAQQFRDGLIGILFQATV